MNMKIIYSNKEESEKILENIKKNWVKKLHILTDFDNTLTKAFVDSKRTPSLLAILRDHSEILWEQFAIEDTKLFEKFHPIEIDPNISQEEKNIEMTNWWTKSFELIIKYWFKKEDSEKLVELWNNIFREWVVDFLRKLKDNDIPIVIISASWIWVEPIKYFFKKNNSFYDNIKIISNDFMWDENWKAISYKKPIIHSFNKSETVLKDRPEIYKNIEKRKNIILLWDSLWDHHMVDWFEYDNLINIWFLNYNEEKLIEEYKKRYDIIITWDWDFSEVNKILNSIKI